MITNRQKFDEYHKNNPEIYRAFKTFAFQAISAGREHLGACLIIERIRWETMISVSDDLKISDFAKPFYARMFMTDYPQFKGFFRTTDFFDEDRPAYFSNKLDHYI